jgi:hypothetical protein
MGHIYNIRMNQTTLSVGYAPWQLATSVFDSNEPRVLTLSDCVIFDIKVICIAVCMLYGFGFYMEFTRGNYYWNVNFDRFWVHVGRFGMAAIVSMTLGSFEAHCLVSATSSTSTYGMTYWVTIVGLIMVHIAVKWGMFGCIAYDCHNDYRYNDKWIFMLIFFPILSVIVFTPVYDMFGLLIGILGGLKARPVI